MDNNYLTLNIPNTDMRVVVKLDDEGVVVDIFNNNDDLIDGTWKTYSELGKEVKELQDD